VSGSRTIPTQQEIWSWHCSLSGWGCGGIDDERGTLKLITPAKRLQPNSLVPEGLVVSCARTISYLAFGDG
jgi:hypothetical protein